MGRYVVLSTLGMGSMGVVVAAYDPELDRKAALKLIRPRGTRSSAARARLGREAQALAKLNHPNVVTIYDVGEHEGQVFVAMEFVRGTTLREWFATPRSWTDAVRVFTAAGRGLAAAHEVGLVHRDFKPDNVMIDAEERVRVMDFGLARVHDDTSVDEVGDEAMLAGQAGSNLLATPLHEPLTRTGALVGTPAYMAPEQWLRLGVSPHGDQFSFCVALYEALYGRSPFLGDSFEARGRAVVRGELSPPPRTSTVPGHVRAVVLRGLARNPIERHASMRALLDALTDDPRIRRRRRALVPLIAALSLAAGWGVWQASAREVAPPRCGGALARLEGVWDDARKAEVRAAIEHTGLSYAADTATRVEQRVDAYTASWVEARREACEAHQRGEESGELLDLRMRCLDERLQHVEATLDILGEANADVVGKAVEAVAELPSLDRCADERALRAEIPPPEDPEVARRVAALDERLIAAETMRRTGEFERGRELATTTVDAARGLDYEPLHVRAWLIAGKLEDAMGSYVAAEALLEQAYVSALALGMRAEAAEAAAELVYVVGDRQARHEAARGWAKSAEPLARAVATPEAIARCLQRLGSVAKSEGKYDVARAYHERALAIREAALGPAHPSVADSLANLGLVADRQGNDAEAQAYHERALKIRETALGPEHPHVASSFNSLGNLADKAGKYEEARAYYERSLAIRERALGTEHPDVATSLGNLGNIAYERGEYEQARAYHRRALAIKEKTLGLEHPSVAATLNNLGVVADLEGEYEEARGHYARSLAIREAVFGPDHPDVAVSLNNLGSVARAEGRYVEARAYHERALAIREKVLGLEHPSVAISLGNLGSVAMHEGDYAEARAHHERALAIYGNVVGLDHRDVAASLANLGDVAQAEGKYEEARAYHERALAIWEKGLGTDHPDLARALTGLGNALRQLGETAAAVSCLERALALRTNHDDVIALADTRFSLAQALWLASDGVAARSRARALAELAAGTFEETQGAASPARIEVREWLSQVR